MSRDSLQKATCTVVFRAEHFGGLITVTKFSVTVVHFFLDDTAENMRNLLKKSTQHKDRQSTRRSGHHSRNVRHPAHRSWKEWGRPRLPWQDLPRATLQRLWLLHNPTCLANGGATPHEHCLPGQREHHGLWQWRGWTRTWPLLWTIGHRLLCPGRPGGPSGQFRVSSGLLRSSKAFPLMVAVPARAVPSLRTGETMVVSMASCAPFHSGKPSTTTSNLRPSSWLNSWRSMSPTRTFTRTRPPASRHTRAATFSRTQPRRPRTPAVPHAARWWPRTSRGRPHRQVRADRGKGSLRRRRSRMRKG